MYTIKKIDDLGRLSIPRDLRRTLRWMGGDEIEIIQNNDNSLTLKKYQPDFSDRLREVQETYQEWAQSNNLSIPPEKEQMFADLYNFLKEQES